MIVFSLIAFALIFSPASSVDPSVTMANTDPPTQANGRIFVARGRDVTLTCFVENLPPKTYVRWQRVYLDGNRKKQTQEISRDMANEDNTKHSIEKPTRYTWRLRIKKIQVVDQGNYTCYAKTTMVHRREATVAVIVQVVPYFSHVSSDHNVRESDDLELICEAEGVPTPSIEWTRMGGAVLPINKLSHHQSRMLLENIRPEDRGIYRCTAMNAAGTVTRLVRLNVQFKPLLAVPDGRVVRQKVGCATTLRCFAQANPFPRDAELSWKRGSLVLSGSTEYDVKVTEGAFNQLTYELVFPRGVRPQHFGTYVCRVDNAVGRSVQTISLQESQVAQPMPGRDAIICAACTHSHPLLLTAFSFFAVLALL